MIVLYEFFRWLALITGWPLQAVYFKRKTYYEDRAVQGRRIRGGALIVSNHFSPLDFFVNFYLFASRKLYVVIAKFGFMHGGLVNFGMNCIGCIYNDRNSMGMKFMDDTVEKLKAGKPVQIFPEGHFTHDGEMHEFKPSYILIALRSGKPIIPVITDGNYGFLKRTHVIIGKPILLSDYVSSENPTRDEIQMLNRMVEDKARELRAKLDTLIAKGKKGC